MRILTVADTPRAIDSGAAGTDVQTIEALRRRGHDVVEVWADELGRRIRHGNLHYAFEAPGAILRAVRRHLADSSFDVVLASQPHGFRAARWLGHNHPHTAFVNRSHGWETHVEEAVAPHRHTFGEPRWTRGRAWLGRLLGRLLDGHCTATARASDGIIVSTSSCRQYILQHYGLDPARVAHIAQAAPDAYRELPLPVRQPDRPARILLVSSAAFFKGLPVARSTLRTLLADRPHISVTWVTDERALRDWMGPDDEPLCQRIAWLGGLSQGELMRVYDEHDIFLFPSFFEGFGKAFLEAMSRGLCVVASDVGGMHDVITQEHDGLLCPAGDAIAFAEALRRVVDDGTLRMRLAARARQTALTYSWDRVGRETEAFCEARLQARLAAAGTEAP
ncbi:MAG: glycosyltransferase family 4 protein [Planctomycetota bacterium]